MDGKGGEKDAAPSMTEEQLAGFCDEHAQRALGHYGTEIASDQARSLDYYDGRMEDVPAVEGCSSVTDSTVQVVTDNFVANIIKPFVSSDEAVKFEPTGPEDEEVAEQATDFANYVIHCDNDGFMIIHDWVKDAGLQKRGVVKSYWLDKTDKRPQLVQNLDPMQAEEMEFVDGPYVDEGTGLYSGFIMDDYEDGRVKLENIPPEEYLISPNARRGEIPPYEAHHTRKYRSDLIEMGFDPELVAMLPACDGALTGDMRTLSRNRDNQGMDYRVPGDPSRDLIEVYHENVMIDFDGDGVSELREIIRCETTILYNVENDGAGLAFHSYTPIPMPHKVYGKGVSDLVINDQRIKTVLQRQQLDNLYKSNNPRPHLPEGSERSDGTTEADLQDATPGAAVREGRVPIRYEAVPFVADKAFQMQEYADREIERKTGIAKEGQSLNRDALNTAKQKTATQAQFDEEGQNARAELMARIFAETGFRSLFKSILRLLIKHQPRARVIRLRNKWVPMDPRGWNADMDVSIAVGLGVGNQRQQIDQAMGMVDLAERVVQSPYASLIPEEKAYAILKRAFTSLGVKNVDDYLAEPEKDEQGNPVPKQEQPDPDVIKAQADAQAQQQKLALDEQKAALDIELQRNKASAQIELEREIAANKMQLEREKAAFEAEQAEQQRMFEMRMAERQFEQNTRLAQQKADSDHELKKYREGGDLDK